MSDTNATKVTVLRDLLAERLGLQWDQFSREHPALAASIDRVQLVESAVDRLSDDPQYRRAMELAGVDETELAAGSELRSIVDVWVRRMLGI